MNVDTTTATAALLLALGVTSLSLAAVAARYSMRGAAHRSGILAVLGCAALAALVLLLWGSTWTAIWEDTLLPLFTILAAAGAGLALGAGLVYVLVAAR